MKRLVFRDSHDEETPLGEFKTLKDAYDYLAELLYSYDFDLREVNIVSYDGFDVIDYGDDDQYFFIYYE